MVSTRMPKTTSQISKQSFKLNGRDTFLYSGEVHYFRIPKRYWEKHLQALVDAGCNAISSYVPWSWHEYKEGKIDFTGKTHPERDLIGFLNLVKKYNLYVTLKPGPYAMAELTDQGIPLWLTATYPETLALDENGMPWGSAYISYTSPVFRRKAKKWLNAFCKRIAVPRQKEKKGALIMMQLCNEIGMFQWLRGGGDYSASAVKSWTDYLKKRFPNLDELGRLLDRQVNDHRDVAPPIGLCNTRHEYILYTLWHDYHRWMYSDYSLFLNDLFREAGVGVPFFTNVGGWVYGRAHEFPLNGTFQRDTAAKRKDIIYGIDHIPEFIAPNNLHDAVVANQVCAGLQRNRGPLYSAELQCGSREHGVQTYPQELGLFYRLTIIHGLTGMNFYMFAQGRNPKGRGIDGPMFYWYNAVDYKANRQPTYPVVQELGEWLQTNGDMIVHSQKPAELGVAFYPRQHETEFLVPILHKRSNLDAETVGFRVDPMQIRDRAWFDGVIRFLNKRSVSYDLPNLAMMTAKQLAKYKTLVVQPNDIMDRATQQKLCDYTKQGGTLVVFPVLPRFDWDFTPCTILSDAFGIKVGKPGTSNRIYMDGLKDVPVPMQPPRVSGKGCKTIAKDVDGRSVGVEKKYGKGRVRFFSYFVNYSSEEHPDLWDAMMQLKDVKRNAWADNDEMHLEARFTKNEGVLFAGNFHRGPVSAHVFVNNPRGRDPIDLGTLELDSLSGRMLPIQVDIGKGITLVYALGELRSKKGGKVILRGPARSAGKIAIKSKRKVLGLTIDGEPVKFKKKGSTYIADYWQSGEDQVVEIR